MQQLPTTTPLFLQPKPVKPERRVLTKEEQEEIKFAYEQLDAGEGLTPKQVKVALRAMGFAVKKADVRELLRRHGEEESATIGLETFQRVMTDKLSERTQQDDMRRAFQLFDVHGLGRIDMPALRKVVKSMGLEIAESELQDMIDEFSGGKDGIDEAAFLKIMNATDE